MPISIRAPARVPGLGIKGVPATLQKHTATVQCWWARAVRRAHPGTPLAHRGDQAAGSESGGSCPASAVRDGSGCQCQWGCGGPVGRWPTVTGVSCSR